MQKCLKFMATQICFDLNAALENWRNELGGQLQLTPDNQRELEKHLADSMVELRQRGLNEEESFWLARRRIGQPQQLAEEFEKVDPTKVWRDRVFWMMLAFLFIYFWSECCELLTQIERELAPGIKWLYTAPWSHWVWLSIYSPPLVIFPLCLIRKGNFLARWMPPKFLRSPVSFGIMLITAYIVMQIYSMIHTLNLMRLDHDVHLDYVAFAIHTLQNSVVDLIFIALAIWLFPIRDSKRPKSYA